MRKVCCGVFSYDFFPLFIPFSLCELKESFIFKGFFLFFLLLCKKNFSRYHRGELPDCVFSREKWFFLFISSNTNAINIFMTTRFDCKEREMLKSWPKKVSFFAGHSNRWRNSISFFLLAQWITWPLWNLPLCHPFFFFFYFVFDVVCPHHYRHFSFSTTASILGENSMKGK